MFTFLLAVAHATVLLSGPRLTPEQAAAVMAHLPSPANYTDPQPEPADGPQVFVIASDPKDSPFGRLRGSYRVDACAQCSLALGWFTAPRPLHIAPYGRGVTPPGHRAAHGGRTRSKSRHRN